MKNKFKLFGIVVLIALIGFSMASCSNPAGGTGETDTDRAPVDYVTISTHTATRGGVTFTFVVREGIERATVGNRFQLTVSREGSEQIVTGRIISVDQNNLVCQPDYNESPTFTVRLSGASITSIVGTLTFNDGARETGPGSFVTGGGGGGSGGGGGGSAGGGATTPPATIRVTNVTLDRSALTLIESEVTTLRTTILPLNATNMAVSWSSSAPGIATVDNVGRVTAVSPGTATITVTTVDGGRTATSIVTVNAASPGFVAVTGVSLNMNTLVLNVGGTDTLTATLSPDNATNTAVTWSSSAPSIASVDSAGRVTAVSPGSAIITATTVSGGFTAQCTVVVNPILPTSVSLNPNSLDLTVGATGALIHTILPANATDTAVTWESSNTAVATVQNGVVTAVSQGTATITVRTVAGNQSATAAVTVRSTGLVPGNTLAEQLAWLREFAQDNGNYTVYIRNDEAISPAWWIYGTGPFGAAELPFGRTNLSITLRGSETMRTISLSHNGILFDVPDGLTLVLDNNVTLRGLPNNLGQLGVVTVESGGTLVMNAGARITGNTTCILGAGVTVHGGIFNMHGGEITGNTSGTGPGAGGVYIGGGSIFNMHGGTISGNNSDYQVNWPGHSHAVGGVLNYGTFNMHGGTITGNNSTVHHNYRGSEAGGVLNMGTFNMYGGVISGNVSLDGGSGVHNTATFNMRGGEITANVSTSTQNTVSVMTTGAQGTFRVSNGIIYGGASGGQHGTFNNGTFSPLGNLPPPDFFVNPMRNAPIEVRNGALIRPSAGAHSVKTVSAGTFQTVTIRTDGTLWAWGGNISGLLGDGTTTDRLTPIQIGMVTDWAFVAAGDSHTVAIRTDGTLWAWGSNSNGQLGDGTTTNRLTPIQIGTTMNWATVATSRNRTVAIRTDGTLWAWGSNSNGQLGDGTTTDRLTPIQIGTATNWASVSADWYHTVAIRTDGTLWAWGQNDYGRLGDGTTTGRLTPIQIGTATNWTSISAGRNQTVAIRTDGTLWAWGQNDYGRLGDGTTTDRLTPIQIGTAMNWTSVSATGGATVAIRTDGTLWAWGVNHWGMLGIDYAPHTVRRTPIQIGVATNWASVAMGWGHTVAVRTDGTLWAWGRNQWGQLGDGTTTDRHTPIQIALPNAR